jgi:hypothetical protein
VKAPTGRARFPGWVPGPGVAAVLPGSSGFADVEGDTVYLAMSVRNAGNGIAVMRFWRVWPQRLTTQDRPDLEGFRRHTRDLYVAPADMGFWQAAFRDPEDPQRALGDRGGQVLPAN